MVQQRRDSEQRPSPEALLEAARREDSRAGRLKIFVGAAPGVGKTYEMLQSAHAKRKAGADVVVGVVETHGRAETEALLHGLEVLPRKRIDYKDQLIEEMDLDALIARHPQIALVDELAHTNAPGSRHPKRYLDVEELLSRGIDVYTAVNIQHIESLNDVVAQITHVRVRETVPDSVFDRADAIELIDRNLYERTCDVRWWATDSAAVDCAADPSAANVSYVAERLAVILRAYTVYLDLWLCDLDGNVLASARSDRYAVKGANVAQTRWFQDALKLRSGDDYVAGDIERQPRLGNAPVATYCASVREGGDANGRPLGVLAIHFDWETQARAIVEGVRVDDDKARVLVVDSKFRVIASSDGQGLLTERVPLTLKGGKSGVYKDTSGLQVAFHLTPGYETYQGLGWFGVIVR